MEPYSDEPEELVHSTVFSASLVSGYQSSTSPNPYAHHKQAYSLSFSRRDKKGSVGSNEISRQTGHLVKKERNQEKGHLFLVEGMYKNQVSFMSVEGVWEQRGKWVLFAPTGGDWDVSPLHYKSPQCLYSVAFLLTSYPITKETDQIDFPHSPLATISKHAFQVLLSSA